MQAGIEAAQLAQRRSANQGLPKGNADKTGPGPNAWSGYSIVVNAAKDGTNPDSSMLRPVNLNTFIAGSETTDAGLKSRIFALCKNASLGTSMTGGYTVWNGRDATTLNGKGVFGDTSNILPSVCTYCLTMVRLFRNPTPTALRAFSTGPQQPLPKSSPEKSARWKARRNCVC